jgi:hypothetical protein
MGLMGAGTVPRVEVCRRRELVQEFYMNKGYVQARVGNPQVENWRTPATQKRAGSPCESRWTRASATSGQRSIYGEQRPSRAETLRRFFKMRRKGDYYSHA